MRPRHLLPAVAGHAVLRSTARALGHAGSGLRLRPLGPLRHGLALSGGLFAALSPRARGRAAAKPSRGEAARAAAGRSWLQFGHPSHRATDIIIVLNAAVFVAQLFKPRIFLLGAKINAGIAAGQLWRLVTPAFLHAGWVHLAVNSYALWQTGRQMEQLCNSRRFLAVYLAGAFGGCLLSYLRSPIPAVGASGAIFGLMGAMGVFLLRHKAFLGQERTSRALESLLQTLVLNGLVGFSARIDNWGHLGGLLGGAAAAYLLGPRWQRDGGRTIDRPLLPLLAGPPKF